MIDLHCHLDGSLSVADVLALSNMTGTPLPTRDPRELFSLLTFSGRGTLNEYLKKFDLPLRLLSRAECVEYAVASISERLAACGVDYAEIRFAPALHLGEGATMREIVQGALKGRMRAKIPLNLKLCCMRGRGVKENAEVVELAAEYSADGVVGVDLAGAEALYPTSDCKEVFSLAARLGLNITIHAGEAASADSVRAALDFGARRIGHGVAAAKDAVLLERIKRDGIALEVCPTSNVQTGAVGSIAEHPVRRFLAEGVPCIICSDNMTVSDTDAAKEIDKLKKAFPDESPRIDECVQSARRYSFERREV